MALLGQPTTASFRPTSKYEYIVPALKVLTLWRTVVSGIFMPEQPDHTWLYVCVAQAPR